MKTLLTLHTPAPPQAESPVHDWVPTDFVPLESEDSRELTEAELELVAGGGCIRFQDTAGCSDNSPPEIHHHNPHYPDPG